MLGSSVKMKNYFIVSETLREAVYCYRYTRDVLRDKISWCDDNWRVINVEDCRLIFTSEEVYWRSKRNDRRADVLNGRYVERQLDRYRVLKGEL